MIVSEDDKSTLMEEEENFLVPRKEHGWAGIQSGCSQQVSKELEAHLA